MGGARVQAATVRLRERFLSERYGVQGSQRLRQLASPALREVITGAVKGWVPFSLFVEATRIVDEQFGTGDGRLAWEVGRFAVSHEESVWKRLMMRHVSPSVVVGLARAMWSHHYDGGRLESRAIGPTSLQVSIVDFPEPHRLHCLAIGGWMLGSLEHGPRSGSEVRELSCRTRGAPSCDFQMLWQDG